MLGADLTGIFISILSGFIISREMLRPLSQITATAQSISIHDLNQRINVSGPEDELTKLSTTFNEMIDRLQKSFDRQNQFVSDASHELRTPISVIQGYINLLDRWGKEEKTILQESITVIKNEAANMGELIEKLLFLARGDSSAYNLNREQFWLDEFIEEVFKETQIIASQHRILLKRNDRVLFYGDRKMLKQMLRAILDNGIKFTPSQGEIIINSYLVNDTVKLELEDTGVGIPQTEIPFIFNRFYQVDKARIKIQSGSGLGLAIVKWIVDAHQGNIEVTSRIGGGTRITIVLPLDKSGLT
jgi:signal transduction histidine kinase